MNGSTTINVDSVAGSGVRTESGSTAVLNGPVNISPAEHGERRKSTTSTRPAGLYASSSTIDVTGNTTLSANQGRGYGLWTGLNPASIIRITGDTTIATHGLQGFGVRLDDGLIALTGNLSVVTGVNPASADALNGAGSAGLRATNGALTVSGSTFIQTVGGISQVGSSVQTSEASYGLWNTSHSRLVGGGANLNFQDRSPYRQPALPRMASTTTVRSERSILPIRSTSQPRAAPERSPGFALAACFPSMRPWARGVWTVPFQERARSKAP